MSKLREGHTRHEVWLDSDTRTRLKHLAVSNDTYLKPLIEAQMKAMGEKGITYLDLWMQLERTTQLLKQLTKEEEV